MQERIVFLGNGDLFDSAEHRCMKITHLQTKNQKTHGRMQSYMLKYE